MENIEERLQEKLALIFDKHQISDDVFAVGVSGGADSLALIYLLLPWAEKNKKKLVVLTVEHGLRKESYQEAKHVADLMQHENIEHHILFWTGEKPSAGIEEAARIARYGLIEDYCRNNGIKYLMIAHHKMDQAETFLMRLQRGSGVDGLSAMSEVSSRDKIEIIRPLLDFSPIELRSYLSSKNIKWVEDISNYDEDFLRVKIRNLIPYLDDKIGLSVDRIANTAKILCRTKDYMEKQVKSFMKNNIKFFNDKTAKISISLLEKQHEEIIFRVIAQLLKTIGERNYIPRSADIQRIVDAILLEGKNFKGRTLGGCEIINDNKNLWIIPEIKDDEVLSKKDWEEFLIENSQCKNIKIPYKVRKFLKNIEF